MAFTLHDQGFPFVGLLFVGFMLTEGGPKVLEYNVRFGDPEAETLMLLMNDDVDLAAVLLVRHLQPNGTVTILIIFRTRQACAEHRLDSVQISSRQGFAVSVVLASGGYPGEYSKGKHIEIGEVSSGKHYRMRTAFHSLV